MQISIPVQFDQPANAKEAERIGFGVTVPYENLSEKLLNNALYAVLNDSKYLNRAREHGSLVVDQIEQPLQRACWWLEHIMRHPHVYRNKSPVHKLSWYQYFCLDVIFTIVALSMLMFTIIYQSTRLCCGSRNMKHKQE